MNTQRVKKILGVIFFKFQFLNRLFDAGQWENEIHQKSTLEE